LSNIKFVEPLTNKSVSPINVTTDMVSMYEEDTLSGSISAATDQKARPDHAEQSLAAPNEFFNRSNRQLSLRKKAPSMRLPDGENFDGFPPSVVEESDSTDCFQAYEGIFEQLNEQQKHTLDRINNLFNDNENPVREEFQGEIITHLELSVEDTDIILAAWYNEKKILQFGGRQIEDSGSAGTL